MGLSFGSLTGKILISSDKKKKKIELLSNELEYNPNLPIVSHSDFRNLGLFTSGEWWQNAAG